MYMEEISYSMLQEHPYASTPPSPVKKQCFQSRLVYSGTRLHRCGYGVPLGQYLGEVLGAEDVAERGLCEQAGRVMGVLDVRYRHRRVADSVIDDRVHRYRHRVLGQNLHVRTSLNVV